jgi:hypothetical protein
VTASDDLILFGHATVARLAVAIESGANLLQCQLLACEFYEAVKQAWSDTPAHEFVRAGLLGAAVTQLRCAAERSPSPIRMLDGIRSAVAMMEASEEPPAEAPAPAPSRMPFRVIDGGLSSRAVGA